MDVASSTPQGRPPRPSSHRKPVGSEKQKQDQNLFPAITSQIHSSPSNITDFMPMHSKNNFPNSSAVGYNRVDADDIEQEQNGSLNMQNPAVLPIRQSQAETRQHEQQAASHGSFAEFHFPFSEPRSSTPSIQVDGLDTNEIHEPEQQPQLQYFHHASDSGAKEAEQRASIGTTTTSRSSESDKPRLSFQNGRDVPLSGRKPLHDSQNNSSRKSSGNIQIKDQHPRGRSLTPHNMRDHSRSPSGYTRDLSVSSNRSGALRPSSSYADLLNIPYAQQMAQQDSAVNNAKLQTSFGSKATVVDLDKTLAMYRANTSKISELGPQFDFALLLVDIAQRNAASGDKQTRAKHLNEARTLLQKLADKSYPYAQYYLGDGYASGLFNDDEPDDRKAFPLFVAAGKHGHAEAAYRAALCYEFGWGCRKDLPKAVQFLRQSASMRHPGAALRLGRACLSGSMGYVGTPREGVKWLKRSTDYADAQHNSAPYELGLLYETGFDTGDVFKDERNAMELFTQSASLGHGEANFRLGEIYEKGHFGCPKEPWLSIHYYNCAAESGIAAAMMVLSASFIVGVPPVLEQDHEQAYMWAAKAAETGLPMALYTVGWCKENGIGCNRDPLDANVWYRSAAEQGDERATKRLQKIMGEAQKRTEPASTRQKSGGKLISKKKSGLFSGKAEGTK